MKSLRWKTFPYCLSLRQERRSAAARLPRPGSREEGGGPVRNSRRRALGSVRDESKACARLRCASPQGIKAGRVQRKQYGFGFRRVALAEGQDAVEQLLLVRLGLEVFPQRLQHGDIPAAQNKDFCMLPQLLAVQSRSCRLSKEVAIFFPRLHQARRRGGPRLAILSNCSVRARIWAVSCRAPSSAMAQTGNIGKTARRILASLVDHDSVPFIKISMRRFSAARGSVLFLKFRSA